MISHSFEDVRPSRFEVAHKFEFIFEEPISQSLRRLPPAYNEIVKKEVDLCSKQILSLQLNLHGRPQLCW